MCKSGNPAQTTTNNTTTNQSATGTGSQVQTSSSVLGPTPETLALYQDFLARAAGVANTPFDTRTLTEYAPWTDALNQAVNYQWGLGQQGMGFVPEASGMIGQGGQSTIGQIPDVAASLLSPWAGQAVDYGLSQGQAVGDWATGQAQNIMSQGPQLQPFSEENVMQYYSPYNQNVVQATQDWFNNQNAIQGNQLLGQGIRSGNVFGGDRAGVAQGVLAGQQQLAQAPVIAGLENQGYAQALQEYNTQNQLAAQLQEFGANLGLQGLQAQGQLGLGGLGMGLNAAGQANAQAIGALGQNQQAALNAGALFGNLGATQFGQNLAGGQAAIGAGGIYPQYLQGLYNLSAQNEQMLQAYPFQTSSWYGGLLGGLGPLTGSQQAALSNLLSQQQVNQIGTQIGSGTTTPPQPNQWIQAAGLGLAGLGLFLKDGGSVPRLARGGSGTSGFPYGEQGVPYGKGSGSVVPSPNIRIGKLTPPDLPQRIQQQNLMNLIRNNLFSGSGNTGAGNVSRSGSGTSTLGAVTSLLGSSNAKKAAGSLSNLFTGGSDTTGVSVGDSGDIGPAETLRRGGLVGRYQDGGFEDDEEPPYEPEGFSVPEGEDMADIDFQSAEEPPSWLGPQAVAGLGAEEAGLGGGALLPRPRPAEAGPPATPSVSAGLGAGPEEGGGRWLQPIPGMGRRRPGLGDLLTNIGIGMAMHPGTGRGIGSGLGGIGAGLAAFRQQRLADEALDRKHTIDNSGETQLVRFADGRVWDTKLKTGKALDREMREQALAQRQAADERAAAKPVVIGQGPLGTEYGVWNPKTKRYEPSVPEEASVPPASGTAATAEAPKEKLGFGLGFSLAPGGDRPTVDPPEPKAVGTFSPGAIKLAAEQYLQTGRLPPGLFRQRGIQGAIISYAGELAESRGMSQRQVAEMWRFAPKQAGWIMGPDGRQAGSLGTLIDHLDTMRDLTMALNNKDNQTYNLIKNKVSKWTGSEYPTNVEAGAEIVGAEVMKAVGAAGAGTGAERATAGLNIGDLRKSPSQFLGAINTVQKLAAGQLRTKYRQAEAIGLQQERLEALVGKRALEVLNSIDQPSGGAPAEAGPKEGDRKQFKQGWGVFRGGKWVPE